jgi:hypothetical protein
MSASTGPVILQFTRLETLQVQHRHRAADDGRELHHAVLVQVGTAHRGVGGTKGHGLGTDLAMPPDEPMDW